MRPTLLLILISFLVSPSVGQEPPVEAKQMTVLFNGKDLAGWNGDSSMWTVREGVIHGETTAENPANGNTFLICEKGKFADFELRLSFRSGSTNNSGIQYRSKHIDGGNAKNKWVVRGYQHEIRNELTFPDVSAFIYDEGGKRGRLCLVGERAIYENDGKKAVATDLVKQDEWKSLFKLDQWNDAVIIARGSTIQHFLNGRLVLEFTDNHTELALKDGIIALQLHAGKPMWVEFKDIRIRELK
jgi:Domain of Unknown Function (DUF1080)